MFLKLKNKDARMSQNIFICILPWNQDLPGNYFFPFDG